MLFSAGDNNNIIQLITKHNDDGNTDNHEQLCTIKSQWIPHHVEPLYVHYELESVLLSFILIFNNTNNNDGNTNNHKHSYKMNHRPCWTIRCTWRAGERSFLFPSCSTSASGTRRTWCGRSCRIRLPSVVARTSRSPQQQSLALRARDRAAEKPSERTGWSVKIIYICVWICFRNCKSIIVFVFEFEFEFVLLSFLIFWIFFIR